MTAVKRCAYRLRIRFHDWMWKGRSPLHRACQRLPLYFSDPHLPSKEWRRGFKVGCSMSEPPIASPIVSFAGPGRVVTGPQTWTAGAVGTTVWIQWP